MARRFAICITGASGSVYGYRLVKELSSAEGVEVYCVATKSGIMVMKQEIGFGVKDLEKLCKVYDDRNFMAPIASGSFRLDGAVIAPCSMKTLSAIATSYEETLAARVGSIALKEKWPLILLTRESPLSQIHLKNMLAVSRAGGIIMPPLPPLYYKIDSMDKLVDITVGRIMTMLGVENTLHREWGGSR